MIRYRDGTFALFEQPAPKPPHHHNAPRGTSDAAARAIEPDAATLRAKVLAYIRESGGCTDEQGMAATGLDGNTFRPRRWELAKQGLIRESGQRRATASGRLAAVWVAA